VIRAFEHAIDSIQATWSSKKPSRDLLETSFHQPSMFVVIGQRTCNSIQPEEFLENTVEAPLGTGNRKQFTIGELRRIIQENAVLN
jgi:hypothetical protein